MALTTRAEVLTRLGLTDDAEDEAAIIVGINRATLTSCTFSVTGTTLSVSPTPGSATNFDLTAAAYDTMSELAAALTALSGIDAETSLVGTEATSLLTSPQTVGLDNADVSGVLTWTNPATNLNATIIDELISRVDYAIARYCNRGSETTGEEQFSSGSRDEYYDGEGQSVLVLRNYPVASVSSVSIIDYDGNSTTLSSGDYRIDGRTGRLWYKASGIALASASRDFDGYTTGLAGPSYGVEKYGWPYGFRNVRVQYTAGYSTIPADLKNVAIDMVCECYLNRRRNTALSGESMSGRSVSYMSVDDAMKKHYAALAPYRSVAGD